MIRLIACCAALTANISLDAAEPTYSLKLPQVVLDGTPVRDIRIEAHDNEVIDRSVDGQLMIRGIERRRDRKQATIPEMQSGLLSLVTEPSEDDLYFVTDNVIEVEREGEVVLSQSVRRLPGWTSLVPPLVAVILAIALRDVLVSLFIAVYSGAVLLWGNPLTAFFRSVDTVILGEIAPAGEGGSPDLGHATILLFTFFLGAMVAVMAKSGGTAALLGRAERFATTRERGQVLTCLLGFLIFFDDYANALLVGGTMRPLTDRLKISRAKLAYLIDATSAPIAGLAIVSTWVGVEIGYIASGYEQVGIETDGYTLFLQTLPYRFYPLYLVVFTLLIAWTGRDFGSMRRAELRRLDLIEHGSSEDIAQPDSQVAPSLVNAIVPLAVLLIGLAGGMAWTGISAINEANSSRLEEEPVTEMTVTAVLDQSQPVEMLFLASFAASAAGLAVAVASRQLRLYEATEAYIAGVKSMVPASMVLVLAWAIARVCDPDHLNTAGYIVYSTSGVLSPSWMPALAFVVAGAVAFATGSSWSTMGLLMPLFIAVGWSLMPAGTSPDAPLMLGIVGAILAGAIFGDHCSPISDTTVLSSAAADCNHIEHVTTQMPYALTVGLVSLVCGYIPTGFGISPLISLPVGLVVLYGVVRLCGRRLPQSG